MICQSPQVTEDSGSIVIQGGGLELRLDKSNGQRGQVLAGSPVADLFLPSSCHANGQGDYSYNISQPVCRRTESGIVIELTSSSTIWAIKRYTVQCSEDRLEYFFSVEGSGDIDKCEFFQGFIGRPGRRYAGATWVEADYEGGLFGRMRSRAQFKRLFNPEPNGLRKQLFAPHEATTIGVRSNKSHCRGNWFFTPGPFCYAWQTQSGQWVGVGLLVKPGENSFVDYTYEGGNGFGLSLDYEGMLRVRQRWESPHVVMLLANDEYEAVEKYCDLARAQGCAPDEREPAFDWWREPIFCGWGAQNCLSLADRCRKMAPRYASQANYERFLWRLRQRGLNPGTIIIDDKWQDRYGDPRPDPAKWPDLRDFVARRHADGQRVLLWFKAWDPEGVPPEECFLDNAGRPVGVNPANPAYERRLRRRIRELIGELGADGFKIDFTADLPRPKSSQGSVLWGVELLRHLLWIVHDEAKTVKEDALIIAHAANPYFTDVVDMLRLNDVAIVGLEDSYVESMRHRQKVARAVSKQWLIDTDNWPSPTLASWLEYARAQPELGVPSLYYVDQIDESGERIDERHAKELAQIWAAYRERGE